MRVTSTPATSTWTSSFGTRPRPPGKRGSTSPRCPLCRRGFLAPLDISTLFGNALDNAIEACEKLPQGQRLVTVKTGRVRDMLLILVENTMDPQAPAHARTTKGDTFRHGYGLANPRRTAEGYGGHVLTRGGGCLP